MPPRGMVTQRAVVRLDRGSRDERFEHVVVEEPLEIRVGDEPIAVTMRTPGADRALAAGFLRTEGIVGRREDLVAVEQIEPNVIEATLAEGLDPAPAKRTFYATSSCGLCGKASIAAITRDLPPCRDETTIARDLLDALPAKLRNAQPAFELTGALHAAALFDREGRLELLHEDVGRHNAADKILGQGLLEDRPVEGRILMVSGRIGFEIVQKAAVARVPIVAGISAPSSLAIDLAERVGMTLIGFLRPPRATIYAGAGRLV